MKLAFIAQPFDLIPPVYNQSLAIWIHELSSRIAKNHEVVVVTRQSKRLEHAKPRKHISYRRITTFIDDLVHKAAKAIDLITELLPGKKAYFFYKQYYFSAFYYLFYIVSSAIALRRDQPDVIVVLNFSQFVPILRRFIPHSKIVLVMQCDWLIELDEGTVRSRLEKSDLILGCSDYITNGIKKQFPEFQNRCHTLHNGSNPSIFNADQNPQELVSTITGKFDLHSRQSLLFVGRITPEKGVHDLIEAMKYVVQQKSNCVLLVVGSFASNPPNPMLFQKNHSGDDPYQSLKDMGYEQHLREMSQEINEHVVFVGEVSHYQLAAYYGVCDIFVHPSSWNEPFGMILTEAMLCNRPIVSTRTGGIPEIVVSGETGLLVEPDNPKAMSAAILELLDDPRKRREMGEAGRMRVLEKFTWEQTSRTFMDILEDYQFDG